MNLTNKYTMRYMFSILLLFYFYHSSGQQLKEADLLGTWTTSNFKYSKWIFLEIPTVEFEPKLIRRGYPVNFFYYLDAFLRSKKFVVVKKYLKTSGMANGPGSDLKTFYRAWKKFFNCKNQRGDQDIYAFSNILTFQSD